MGWNAQLHGNLHLQMTRRKLDFCKFVYTNASYLQKMTHVEVVSTLSAFAIFQEASAQII